MKNGTACYLRKGNKTLFLHRHGGEGDIHQGMYVFPGGRTERGERGRILGGEKILEVLSQKGGFEILTSALTEVDFSEMKQALDFLPERMK